MNRRGFIALAPALAFAACKRRPARRPDPCGPRAGDVAGSTAGVTDRAAGPVLDPEQRLILAAACARLMPTDGEPGATEAGVVRFIEGQLALPQFRPFLQMLGAGLREMDRLARDRFRAAFARARPEEQDQILSDMQRGVVLGRRRDSRQLFRLLLTFTLEGFLGDPVYGGNRDRVGWRFIGFEPRAPRPRCPRQ